MFKDLSAYTPATPPQGYPPFINISQLEDGTVRVIVRPESVSDGSGPTCPAPVAIILPSEIAIDLFSSAYIKLVGA